MTTPRLSGVDARLVLWLWLAAASIAFPHFEMASASVVRSRALLVDRTADCTWCPGERRPVCTEAGLVLQNQCLAHCQGVAASAELCPAAEQQHPVAAATSHHLIQHNQQPQPQPRPTQRRSLRVPAEQQRRAHIDDTPHQVASVDGAGDGGSAEEKVQARDVLTLEDMNRFKAEGYVLTGAQQETSLPAAAAAEAAGSPSRRRMQAGGSGNPLPSPLLLVDGRNASAMQRPTPEPAVVIEYRVTPDGLRFAKTYTPAEMDTYRAQRGRASASGPSFSPQVVPTGRRRETLGGDVEASALAAAAAAGVNGDEQEEEDANGDDDIPESGSASDAEGTAAASRRQLHGMGGVATGSGKGRRSLHYVIPTDDRVEETTNDYPGRAAGRFTYRNAVTGVFYYCTGAMISNNAVLLAAHCVINIATGRWHDRFSFAPGQRTGATPYGTATVKFVTYTNLYTATAYGNDLAVAILSTQPGDVTGWVGYGYDCVLASLPVITSGYPSDKSAGSRWRTGCTTDLINPCLLLPAIGLVNKCDTVGGQSGAAIFTNTAATGPRARFVVAYEAANSTVKWNGAAVINGNTFPFIDNTVRAYKVPSPPPPPVRPPPPKKPPPPPSKVKGRKRKH